MNAFLASARHELLNNRRSRTAHLLLVVFVGMVAASSVIGWLTNSTVTGVYEKILAAGLTSAPNPFSHVFPLYYASNSVIYVVLIGALMAIVLGVQATLRDRKAATIDLVFSRPVSPAARLLGQLAGLGVVIAVVLAVSMAISWALISVIVRSVRSCVRCELPVGVEVRSSSDDHPAGKSRLTAGLDFAFDA